MGEVFKRYFPVIVKPFVLILLFFLVVTVFCFAIWPFMRPDPRFTPEMRDEEFARLENPTTFLFNVLRGNFGYSYVTRRPVIYELTFRLGNSLLLVGVSAVSTALITTGFALAFKRGRRRPSTLAHSLHGYVFGLTGLVGLFFLLLFGYYLKVWTGWGSPLSDLHSFPPPTEPLAYLIDFAGHLFLPVFSLVLVGVARGLMVIWSSGSPYTTRSLFKKLLFPCTTTDFTITISALVLIEYVFTLPGLGRYLLDTIRANDFNGVVGAFVMLLVLAVGLGSSSILFDLIQRLSGIRTDLDAKIESPPKSIGNPTFSGKNWLRRILRRKGFLIGLVIVLALVVFAAIGPLIAPYDPLRDRRRAESFAMPQWATMFPQNRDLPPTQNISLYWALQQSSIDIEWGKRIALQFDAATTQQINIRLVSNFTYQYLPPNSFKFQLSLTAENVTLIGYQLEANLVNPEGEQLNLWSYLGQADARRLVEIQSTEYSWMSQRQYTPGLDNVAQIWFAQRGTYSVSFDITLRPMTTNSKINLKVEDSVFTIPGLVHGVLGTDNEGRDIFSQLVHSTRNAMLIAFPIALLALAVGFPFGFLAGYFEGWVDNIIIAFVDTLLIMPIFLLFLVYISISGPSILLFVLLTLPWLPAMTAKAFRNTFYIRAPDQKFKGTTPEDKIVNLFIDFLANFCLTVGSVLLLLLGIDFLGYGDPRMITWGKMLQSAFGFGAFSNLAWWWILPPIFLVGLFLLGFLLMGSSLDNL